ncbi:MAG: hypothetical protein HY849_11350 [Nitrosomonadales bacterium]|nr:hypothetical protein [Nitrosomonadales bacterium]
MKLNRTSDSLAFARLGSVVLLSGLLASCGGEDAGATIPTQQWQGVEIRVESRPMPPQPGMNEFLVMATGARGRPAFDLMVSLRTSDQDVWRQAIQDGQVGVYRRAVDVEPGERSVLQVQIKRKGEESVLRFPLGVVAK